MSSAERPAVRVGQVWADWQRGHEGRTVRVEWLETPTPNTTVVHVRVAQARRNGYVDTAGRRTRLSVATLHRCYRLLSEPD